MTSVWGQPTSHRYKVKFNKLGKPVGKNKSRFTEFLGTISRNGSYAPIDVQDWRKIDKSRNKDIVRPRNFTFLYNLYVNSLTFNFWML